jgi:hypothetical protein
LPYLIQFRLIADDMFVIIALPNGGHIRIFAKPFADPDFKTADNGTDGFGG